MSNESFDAVAASYDEQLARGLNVSGENKEFFARRRVEVTQAALSDLGVIPRTIIDFGCGTGTSIGCLRALPEARSVYGIDTSQSSLDIARSTHPEDNVFFSRTGDYKADGDADLVFTNGVFHHIPIEERSACFSFIFRCLRPGGVFAFWENNPWSPATRFVMSRIPFDADAVLVWPRSARKLLLQAGFECAAPSFWFIYPRCLSVLRGSEPYLAYMPLGAQYQIIARKPESGETADE